MLEVGFHNIIIELDDQYILIIKVNGGAIN
jgi:hypothetical protein